MISHERVVNTEAQLFKNVCAFCRNLKVTLTITDEESNYRRVFISLDKLLSYYSNKHVYYIYGKFNTPKGKPSLMIPKRWRQTRLKNAVLW